MKLSNFFVKIYSSTCQNCYRGINVQNAPVGHVITLKTATQRLRSQGWLLTKNGWICSDCKSVL